MFHLNFRCLYILYCLYWKIILFTRTYVIVYYIIYVSYYIMTWNIKDLSHLHCAVGGWFVPTIYL